ncbi:MAG: Holliday junction resolvase RuvX [Planctomycetota bacterium]
MRILGLDYGSKRIGVAISDELGLMAHGHGIINNTGPEETINQIQALLTQEKISQIVVGLPKTLNNTIGPKAQEVLKFVEELKTAVKVPVFTWDERLTTFEAEILLREMNLSRRRKRKQVNVVAAQLILQGYMDATKKKGDCND